MPELPEVETARRMLDRAARGRRIVAVRAARDPIVFERVAPRRISDALTGARVIGTGRRGKHFWLVLDRRPFPLFHFGMTGGMRIVGPGADGGDRRWLKLELGLEGGRGVVFTDARRLGRIRLRHDPEAEPPVSRLGWDPLLDLPAEAEFARQLGAARRPVKALLLDQGFSAGVGNWLADEALYQSGIDPRRRASGLDAAAARRLRSALARICRIAVRAQADDRRFPRSWLFHVRWGRRDALTPRGERLRFVTIAGRTTAFAPAIQQ